MNRQPREPWTLDEGWRTPHWLHLRFEQRTRYEYLSDQFRLGIGGNDEGLALRTILLTELRFDPVDIGLELMDSRLYLNDDDAFLSTALINPLDVLQAYLQVRLADTLASGDNLRIRIGRQTMDVGSRRFAARNRYRNTINAFTGGDAEWTSPDGDTARLLVTVPVRRRPDLLDALADNERQSDTELERTVFWGMFYGSRTWSTGLEAEAFTFGLHEEDEDDVPTRDRNHITPGLRLLRPAAPAQLDFEVELAFQAGSSRFSALPGDTTDLRHQAFFIHGELGYTFEAPWRPRVTVFYDHASGDRDPSDDTMERFDTLYGVPRFDFGPTSLYGALERSNIRSPGIQADAHPTPRLRTFFRYRAAWLDSARDLWTTALLWDPAGESGTFIGHQVEAAARWSILPESIHLEGGLAHLWLGEFPRQAPGGNSGLDDPTYAYLQVAFHF